MVPTRGMGPQQDVWQSPMARRVTFNTDLLAYSTTLMAVTASIARLTQHLPTVQAVRFGPAQPLFSAPVVFSLYASTAAAALVLMALRPSTYFQQRWRISIGIRVLRLGVQLATMLTPAAAKTLVDVMVARGQEAPQKAASLMIIQPLAYYIQPAMVLLPWRHMLLVQMVSTAAMMHWLWLFPCFLPEPQDQASTATWQPAAQHYCSSMQSVVALFRAGTGGLATDFTYGACSTGLVALQTCQVFVNLVFLLGLPTLVVHELERWLLRLQRARPQDFSGSGPPAAAVSIPSSSSSVLTTTSSRGAQHSVHGAGSSRQASSSSRGGSSSSSTRLPTSPAGSSSTLRRQWSAADVPAEGAGPPLVAAAAAAAEFLPAQQGGSVFYRMLVAVVVLPVSWLLAELVAHAFESRRDCAAILAAAAAA